MLIEHYASKATGYNLSSADGKFKVTYLHEETRRFPRCLSGKEAACQCRRSRKKYKWMNQGASVKFIENNKTTQRKAE